MRTIIRLMLLAVVNLIHCQEQEPIIVFTLQGVLEKLEGLSEKMKGYEAIQQKQDEIMGKLIGYEELLHRIPDMQGKLQHLENSLQGLSRETGQCLRGDDLEHLTNVSAAAHQEIKSFVHEEISGVISLAKKDECSEGSLLCGEIGNCENTLFSFTCSCPSGFNWDGSDCADIDECAEGKGVCSPNAMCNNSIGSYSCSCNKPFEGDGRISCELQCRSPAKFISGLGCVKLVEKAMTYEKMNKFCQEEEGWRLLQDFCLNHLTDINNAFLFGGWVGVYDETWTNDESLVPKDLWEEEYLSDPLRRCGVLTWDPSPASFKVSERYCSDKRRGLCQFPLP